MTNPSLKSRILLVDLLKALAAQLIVLHHLSWYGPLSDQAAALSPWVADIKDWLAQYGRYAVSIFFASGGFLAAQLLSPRGLGPQDSPWCLIRDRYLRLILPFAIALLLAVLANFLARQWMVHESIGSPPQVLQVVAHLTLLHTLLDIESISAGVWYVAIDFQLYAMLVLLLWLGSLFAQGKPENAATSEFSRATPVLLFALASLFYFNHDARWDPTALFFFGSYALGVAAGWAIRSRHRNRILWLIVLLGGLSLWLNFRPRIALAVVTALILGHSKFHMSRIEIRSVRYFGNVSYALFLVHFPVCLLINAAFQRFSSASPAISMLGFLTAWLTSNLLAHFFHRYVELPLLRWHKRTVFCPARRKQFEAQGRSAGPGQ